MTRLARAAAVGIALSLVVGATGACDYATRKREAKLLVDAAKRAEQQRTVTGTLEIGADVEKVSPEFAQLTRATTSPPLLMKLDFEDRLGWTAGVVGIPQAIFAGPVVYLHRPEVPGAAESQFGFRSWSKLDFSDIGRKETNDLTQPTATNPVNPAYLVRMLAGTLSGSVKQIGTEVIDGRTTRHFRMNVDRAKAFRSLGDDDHQAVDKAFASNSISGEVYKKAEAWIDDDGLPRRFVMRVRQKLDQDNIFGITYRLELQEFGTRVAIRAPRRDNTSIVDSWNSLLNSAGTRA